MEDRPNPGPSGVTGAVIVGVVGVWVVAVMAAVDPEGLAPYGPLRHGIVTVGVFSMAALVVFGGVLRAEVPSVAALGVVVVLVAVAAVFAEVPTTAVVGTAERRLGVIGWVAILLAFLVGQSVVADQVRTILTGLAVGAVVVGGAAIAEWWGWDPPGSGVPGRLSSTFGNPALSGAATLILLPVAVGVSLDSGSGRARRMVGGVATVGALVALIGSGARAAWFGAAVAGVVVVVARRRTWPVRRWSVLFGVVALVVTAGVVLGPIDERLGTFVSGSGGVNGRWDEWRTGAAAVAEHPVLGVGPDGYRTIFPTVVDEAYVAEHGRDVVTDRAHAGPLDVALAGGVAAGLAWLIWWGLVARAAWTAIRREGPAVAGAAAGVLAYGVGQLGLFPLLELDVVVALVAGLIVGRVAAPARVRTARTSAAVALVPLTAAVALAVVSIAGLVADRRAADGLAAAVAGSDRGVRLAADAVDLRPDVVPYRLVLARAQAGQGTPDGLRAALATLDAARRRGGNDPAITVEQGEFSVRLAELARSPADIDAARVRLGLDLAHDPHHPTLWLQLASVEVIGGDLDAALAAWRRAADLAPQSAVPLVESARALLAENRPSDAAPLLAEALERQPSDPEARRLLDLAEAALSEGAE